MRAMFTLFFCLISSFAQAKTVDLSTMSDPTGSYDIAFCARPSPDASGKPGHMFVAYSHATPSGDRDFLSIGHTVLPGVGAGSAIWSYFKGSVGGMLKAENYTAIKQNCLDVQVNKADYETARGYAKDPLIAMGVTSAPSTVFEAYKLGADDCMSFAIEVASSLKAKGLKVPDRGTGELPMYYMQRLIDAN